MALFEPILGALHTAGVRYVVVGGVAVVLQGHARMTADLDIALDLSPRTVEAAVAALGQLGLRPRAPVDPDDPFRSVDIFVDEPIAFDDLFDRSDTVHLGDVPVHVASIGDLITMKRIAGRPQDVADVEALEALEALEARRGEDEV